MATGQDLVSFALAQRGKPYEWGEEGPAEYDCSGLIWDAARHLGLSVPRTTAGMYGPKSNLLPISKGDLQPGDLVLSKWEPGAAPVSHVAMWVGDGTVVEAPQEGQVVRTTKYGSGYQAHTVAFRRIPGVNGTTAGRGAFKNPDDSGGGIGGALSNLWPGFLPNPGNLTDATQNVATAIGSTAQSARSIANAADLVAQAFTPAGILRGVTFMFGVIFLLIGIWFLAREIRDSSP